jgi:formylglycine-generating enzyme required for sulfatase activity
MAMFSAAFCFALLIVGASQALEWMPESGERTYVNSIGMDFVLIPAGSFESEDKVTLDEMKEYRPKMIISKSFYLGKYEVTQEQWAAVMDDASSTSFMGRTDPEKNNVWREFIKRLDAIVSVAGPGPAPSCFKGRTNPVNNVSWDDVQEFIKRLNAKEGHNKYRLPTDTEWEYAARGGTDTTYFFMKNLETTWEDAEPHLDAYAWFYKNSGNVAHPVGQKMPNPNGLYDVYGNVGEWTQDWYVQEITKDREMLDWRGPEQGSARAVRGGSWHDDVWQCRSGSQQAGATDFRSNRIGFRLALSRE